MFAENSASPRSAPMPAVSAPALSVPVPAVSAPPTAQTSGRTRTHQLWYAAVFPNLGNVEHAAAVLQRLCLHAQTFTSFVSTEPPNALLLEIKGSLKLFGPLERLHADIDAYDQAIEALHRLAGDTPEARAVIDALNDETSTPE